MKFWLSLALCLLVGVGSSEARGPRHHPIPIGPSNNTGNSRPFAPLHTYFMAATGCNDANPGTVGSPWCSPDNDGHIALVCGDVIIAAPGAYTAIGPSHSPGTCPSTLGGNASNPGGIYHAIILCGGTDLEACKVTNAGGNAVEFENVNNWAIEGFKVTNNGDNGRAFESKNCLTTGSASHHHAYINNIAFNTSQGFGMNDCGIQAVKSVDYWAVVGNIAQNAAQDSICLAAIDSVGPGVLDLNAGTHQYMYGNFSYANPNVGCRAISDTEDFMFDTWDFHGAAYAGAMVNNIGFGADRMCLQITGGTPNAQTNRLYNNTCFRNNLNTGGDSSDGEININTPPTGANWNISQTNNIAYQPLAVSLTGGGAVSAYIVDGVVSGTFVNGASGTQNVYLANNGATCPANFCDSTNSAGSFGTSGQLGTNTYTNPLFANTTDLLANRAGAPNCAGFINVTQCMGWNANTNTLTTLSVIGDLQASCVGCSGKGYQKPSNTCRTPGTDIVADFPVWLKSIVYLHWTGSTVVQNFNLVTLPCGM